MKKFGKKSIKACGCDKKSCTICGGWDFNTDQFTIEIGDRGWFQHPLTNKWYQLIITQDGVFLDGVLIAKGKLKLVENKK